MSSIQDKRPLSPHLQVYRPQITSVMSILHRITGFSLAIGTVLLVSWLWATAYSAEYFDYWRDTSTQLLPRIFLIGWTFAFYYHLCNGIRHLFWDTGRGFQLDNVTKSGIAVLTLTLLLTIGTWCQIL